MATFLYNTHNYNTISSICIVLFKNNNLVGYFIILYSMEIRVTRPFIVFLSLVTSMVALIIYNHV